MNVIRVCPSLSLAVMLAAAVAIVSSLVVAATPGAGTPGAGTAWRQSVSLDGSRPTPRHEAGAVSVDGRFYLFGGRGSRPFEVYDPEARRWRNLGNLPAGELHHFQPVAIDGRIYIVGAMRCCYPNEPIERTVHVYDTRDGEWTTAGTLPEARARGGAGTIVRDGLIYLVGGNTRGHDGGAVPWFDAFDPRTGLWRVLPDAPNARDHFTAALVGTKLVAAGGRTTDLPNPFDGTVAATDVYDFERESWREGADIPTRRAGTMTVSAGGEVVVAGGEAAGRESAYATVESYVVAEDRWRTLQPMIDPRHGGGAVVLGDTLHVAAGSIATGGGPETAAHETLALVPDEPVDVDSDADGLADAAERDVWMTDPMRADTDDDGIDDGDEAERGTDPLVADSDTDGLTDGAEIERGTDPLLADSDADGLVDGAEIAVHETDPTRADTDADGLEDGAEIDRGTDPLRADTDGDSLADGAEITEHGTDPLRADSDGDGLDDDEELGAHGTDPLRADSDADGLDDGEEIARGTDPRTVDSDFDGEPDARDPEPLSPTPLVVSGGDADGGGAGGGGGGALWLLIGALLAVCVSRRSRAPWPAS